jgi:mono/diheme cytochrome c family protein
VLSARRVKAGAIAAILFATALGAGTTAPTKTPLKGPRIRFDAKSHDFGPTRSDTKVAFKFVFHNDGDEPLLILETRPSCACTATVPAAEAIPPGGTGTIDVTFDPATQFGQVHKSVAVTSNDPVSRVVVLAMQAEVIPTGSQNVGNGHPPISGQSLLIGSCGKCHAQPAVGKAGADLWAAVCAACHGKSGEGLPGRGPSLVERTWLSSHDDKAIFNGIAFGTVSPKMPGYSRLTGGPLDDAQVLSLVELLRSWGADAKAPPPSSR